MILEFWQNILWVPIQRHLEKQSSWQRACDMNSLTQIYHSQLGYRSRGDQRKSDRKRGFLVSYIRVWWALQYWEGDAIRKPTTISRPSNCNDLSALKWTLVQLSPLQFLPFYFLPPSTYGYGTQCKIGAEIFLPKSPNIRNLKMV